MANNKYIRTNFITDQTVDGIVEKDLVDNGWNLFVIKRPTTFFTISSSYIGRPDLLSLKLYGKMSYWWILAKVNKIDDFWNDLHVEDIIQVPDVRDVEDYYAAYRKSKI